MGVWHAFRSAITGLFVSKEEAEEHPDTTVRETFSRDEKKKGKRKKKRRKGG